MPAKAPDLPEGWTALIEAEKQKKDIRSIVLPSHTNTDEIVKRFDFFHFFYHFTLKSATFCDLLPTLKVVNEGI